VQPTDFQKFKQIMAGMGRVFGADTDGVILDAYWLALKVWDLTDFERAAAHLLANSQFMPKPADFTALRKAGEETPGEAFARARQIVRRLNPRELISHRSGDERLDKAIRACGGYEALAMCESDNIGFFERRFASHYETISDAEDIREELPALTFGGESALKALGQAKRINGR
jgi:hypothetical protein